MSKVFESEDEMQVRASNSGTRIEIHFTAEDGVRDSISFALERARAIGNYIIELAEAMEIQLEKEGRS